MPSAPDYWERNRAYALKPERNTQLDMGAMWQHGAWQTSASLFASNIKNFILVYNDKGMSNAKNISAVRYGGELESKWKFAPNWEIGGSLAYTHGKNRSDNLPLAQTPPLEAKTFLNWDNGKFSAGALWWRSKTALPKDRATLSAQTWAHLAALACSR